MFSYLLLVALLAYPSVGLRYIEVGNDNGFPIWIQTRMNPNGGADLPNQNAKLDPGARIKYDIQDSGWAGRLWPKTGCDGSGNNCEFGQSEEPCPNGGCQPPSNTLIEFFFPPAGSSDDSFYDISLVDGYSMPAVITPMRGGAPVNEGPCIQTNCNLQLAECPMNEKDGVGNLRVDTNGHPVACLSPCRKYTYPAPYGFGKPEKEGEGRLLCCPGSEPNPVTVEECRSGPVVLTDYVELIRRICPTAYSYSYDDVQALHNCRSDVSFSTNFYM